MKKLPPHILDDADDWQVSEDFEDLDKRVEILSDAVGGVLAWVDNDDVPNIGVSAKGFGHDVATLMAAAPKLRDMVKKLLAENPHSAHATEATALLQSVTFTVVLPEDYEDDE